MDSDKLGPLDSRDPVKYRGSRRQACLRDSRTLGTGTAMEQSRSCMPREPTGTGQVMGVLRVEWGQRLPENPNPER